MTWHCDAICLTGTHHASMLWLGIGTRERFAVVTLTALIFIGGLVPQYNVASCERAAHQILRERPSVAKASPHEIGSTVHDPD